MNKDSLILKGKKALITGGSCGLGKQITSAYISEGADVCICARTEEDLFRTIEELKKMRISDSQIVTGVRADISNENDVEQLFQYAENNLNDLDILVNNAGIQGAIGSFYNVDWDKWKDTIAVNLYGTANCMRQAICIFLKKMHGGKVINLSGGGATGSRPNFSAYAASKTAIVRLTEIAAEEMKEQNIYINAIAPGAMNTRMTKEVIACGRDFSGEREYESAVKRLDEDDHVMIRAAELAVYLASDKSDGITGRLISAVWDDWKHFHEQKDEIMGSELYTLRRIVKI